MKIIRTLVNGSAVYRQNSDGKWFVFNSQMGWVVINANGRAFRYVLNKALRERYGKG